MNKYVGLSKEQVDRYYEDLGDFFEKYLRHKEDEREQSIKEDEL